MKTAQDIKKSLMGVSEDERKKIESLVQDLKVVLQSKEIDEDVVRKLNNVYTSVASMKDNFMWRLLRAAKQNHML